MATGCINGIYTQASDAANASQLARYGQLGSVRYTLNALNAKNTGATKIFTSNNDGTRFYPQFLRIVVESANTVTIPAQLSLGTNSAAYDNVSPIVVLTTLITTNLIINLPLAVAIASIAPNTDMFVKVTTGATATTLTLGVDVFGDYR